MLKMAFAGYEAIFLLAIFTKSTHFCSVCKDKTVNESIYSRPSPERTSFSSRNFFFDTNFVTLFVRMLKRWASARSQGLLPLKSSTYFLSALMRKAMKRTSRILIALPANAIEYSRRSDLHHPRPLTFSDHLDCLFSRLIA